jgi:hypothetical protein
MASVPQSGGDSPVKGQSHDEQQAAKAFRMVDLGVLDAEASTKGGFLESHTSSPCQQPFMPN